MSTPTTADPLTTALSVALDDLRAAGGSFRWTLSDFRSAAAEVVDTYRTWGVVALDLQPGDGTSYKMLLTNLAHRHPNDWARPTQVVENGAWGGELLVSLPSYNRSLVLGLPAFVMPEYLSEKTDLRWPSATMVAVFLSLFSAEVAAAAQLEGSL